MLSTGGGRHHSQNCWLQSLYKDIWTADVHDCTVCADQRVGADARVSRVVAGLAGEISRVAIWGVDQGNAGSSKRQRSFAAAFGFLYSGR